MAKKRRPAVFSATKAVKANARDRVGMPPPAVPIPDRREKAQQGPVKHRRKLEEIIAAAEKDSER